MNGMYEELIEKLRKNNRMSGWTHIDRLMDDAIKAIEALQQENEQLQELAQAKADGRLVVLPCKVGTRVWVISQNCDFCHDMYTEEPCLFGDCEYRGVIESLFTLSMADNFGKTVFLTKEAAEKALSPICNTTKLPCAECNPVCEHRKGE
jgi:hypothetical protein